MSSLPTFVLYVAVLVLIQAVAALPWLFVLLRSPVKRWSQAAGVTVAVLVGLRLIGFVLGRASVNWATEGVVEFLGRIYGSVLHLQLLADVFVVTFALLLWVWPKGAAVALAAFREGVRQPMFWLIMAAAVLFMIFVPLLPYFTFGEDHLMVKELGQDVIMLGALVFGAILASLSISEEIEGRTAVTLMSKPVSRRQFLLGKYVGILLASLLITVVLGWCFDWMMLFTRWYDAVDPVPFPASAASFIQSVAPTGMERQAFLRGASWWAIEAADALPGLVLGFGQVMVLLAVAVCLATRLPMAANVTTCVVVYIVSHLSPILLATAQYRQKSDPSGGSTVTSMLMFVAQLFDRVLPGLQLFKPTQITDAPIPLGDMAGYAGEVTLYALMYTAIVLLFGLVLFEDRDLA
jgi:ABC-type transport system involved in multi-copper enzyme maturation permease subunit